MARRFVSNFFTFVVVWDGAVAFFSGILHELKNSYRHVFPNNKIEN